MSVPEINIVLDDLISLQKEELVAIKESNISDIFDFAERKSKLLSLVDSSIDSVSLDDNLKRKIKEIRLSNEVSGALINSMLNFNKNIVSILSGSDQSDIPKVYGKKSPYANRLSQSKRIGSA